MALQERSRFQAKTWLSMNGQSTITPLKRMTTSTITIRTESEVTEKIGRLAKAMDRSRNWVIEDALKHYLRDQEWQIEGIHQGIESLERGAGIDHESVKDRINQKIAATPKT